MKTYLDRTQQNDEMQPILSSNKEIVEKTEKTAIDAIVLYLKNMDNTARLKRSYSREESLENLDFVTEFYDYKFDIEHPNKKIKSLLEAPNDCVLSNSLSLQYAGRESQRNFNTVLEAVQRDGLELQYVSRRLQDDSIIVLHAVRQNGLAIQYASKKRIQSDYLVLQAVRQNGLALQYLYPKFQDRFDIVAAAVRQNGSALSFASKRLQNDNEIIEFARLGKKTGCSSIQHWLR